MAIDINTLQKHNPWWKHKEAIDRDFHLTKLEDSIINWKPTIIQNFEIGIYSLRGPRQIGKTTWIKLTIKRLLDSINQKDIFFFPCDMLNSKEDIVQLIETYLDWNEDSKRNYIFLDEISFIKDWQRAIKYLYDNGKLSNTTLVLTGSHSIDIKKSIEKLPGRIGKGKRHFNMFPLSFYEYLFVKNSKLTKLIKKKNFNNSIKELKIYINELNKEFKNYLLAGGFPISINDFLEDGKIDETTYEIYFNWIIGDLEKWGKKEGFSKQIMRRIFDVYTSQISWSSIKKDTEIESHSTIMEYVSTFEDIFCVEYINKLDWNKKIPDFPKNKKIYYIDPFIFFSIWKLCYSEENNFELSRQKINNDLFLSKMIEGVVLNHLIKILNEKSSSNKFDYKNFIFFWNNQSKTKEIDFCVKIKKEMFAFEVKWQNKIEKKELKLKKDFKNLIILSKSLFIKDILPVSVFLLLIDKWYDEVMK